jgi:hypothetical protein
MSKNSKGAYDKSSGVRSRDAVRGSKAARSTDGARDAWDGDGTEDAEHGQGMRSGAGRDASRDAGSGDAGEAQPEPISENLETLANELIDYGLENLGQTGHLTTTLAVEDSVGNREMLTFEDDAVDECVAEARDVVRRSMHKSGKIEGLQGRAVRYAIAYDGAIRETEKGPYQNALIVEYGEHGMSSAYSAYLLYKKAGHPKDFVWTDPAAAGETELLV